MAKKHNCGPVMFSTCVLYGGEKLTFLTDEDLEDFPCNANMNDVVSMIDLYLKKALDEIDLTELDADCLEFDPETVTVKELLGLHNAELCLLKGQVTALSTQLNDLNIGNELIVMDLACMTPDAAPCAVEDDTYSLLTILQTFRDKLCDLESRLSNLES